MTRQGILVLDEIHRKTISVKNTGLWMIGCKYLGFLERMSSYEAHVMKDIPALLNPKKDIT